MYTQEQLRQMTPDQLAAIPPDQLQALAQQGLLTRYANANDSTDQFGNPLGPTYNLANGDGTNRAIRTGGEAGVSNSYRPTGDRNLAIFAALAGGMGAYSAYGAGAAGGTANSAATMESMYGPTAGGVAPSAGTGTAGTVAASAPAVSGTVAASAPASAGGAVGGNLLGTGLMAAGTLGQLASQPDLPQAPNYTDLANQQTQDQLALNRSTTQANRYNEVNPYGQRTWAQDPNNPDQWTSTTTLSPQQQAIFDQEQQLSQQYGQTAQNLLGAAQTSLSTPFDFNDTDRSRVEGSIYDSFASRLDPRFDRAETSLHTRLANQGLTPGSEAYTNAMQDFNFGRNDAYQQANNAAVGAGVQETNNAFQRQLTTYNQPLNSLNALRSGNQATVPNFGAGGAQAQTPAANLTGAAGQQYGAATDAYNATSANNSNFWGGLMNLGSTMYRYS